VSPPVQTARNYTHHRYLLLLLSPKADTHFTVPQRVEGWVDLAGWLHTETVTHPGTNRVWRSATTLIEANALPLSQTTKPVLVLLWVVEVGMLQCMIQNQNEMHKLSKVKIRCKYEVSDQYPDKFFSRYFHDFYWHFPEHWQISWVTFPGFPDKWSPCRLSYNYNEQGHCGACRKKWRLTDTDLCPCGETQTVSHIVESCSLTKLNGGLSRLHSVGEDAFLWLTSCGWWHE